MPENNTSIPDDTAAGRRWHPAAVFLMLYALAFLIYGHSLHAPFYFDDLTKIVENPHIRLTRLSWSEITEIPKGQAIGRSLPFFTFAANYYFHQYEAPGYQIVNILIHIACGFLVFLLCGQTLRLCGRNSLLIPLLAALLWLSHPLHTQSVTYLVQRINSMAAFFCLMSLWLYIKFRLSCKQSAVSRFLLMAGCLLCGLAALLSKENSFTLPVLILLFEWYFFQHRQRSWLEKNLQWLWMIILLLILIAFVYLGADPIGKILAGYQDPPFTMGQRLLSQARVIVYYISLLAFPHPARLNIDCDFPVSTGLTSPLTTLPALGALAALLAAAVIVRRNRLLSFALLWFLIALSVESSIVGLMLVFEHRTYLPSVFPVILLAFFLYRHVRPGILATVLLSALIAANGFWTFQRNTVWQNRLVFWRNCAEKSPQKARPHNNYGLALKEKGNPDRAVKEYKKAIALYQGAYPAPYNNLGMLHLERDDFEKAAEFFQKAIQKGPKFFKPYMNMGSLLNLTGRNRQALFYLKKALQYNQYSPEVHVSLGKALFETGNTQKAVDHCLRALALDPRNVNAENNLGAILLGIGRPAEAISHLKRVLQMAPNHAQANINIGLAYYKLGDVSRAAFHLGRAVFLAPEHAGARAELGIMLLKEGRPDQAQEHLEKALDLKPEYPKVRLALASLFLEKGRIARAEKQYHKILEADPENKTARRRLEALPENDNRAPVPTG